MEPRTHDDHETDMAAALQLLLVTLLARVAAASASAPLKLSSPRRMLTGVTVGEYSLFGGGFQGKEASRAVDVYRNGQFVRTDQLSQVRAPASRVCGVPCACAD